MVLRAFNCIRFKRPVSNYDFLASKGYTVRYCTSLEWTKRTKNWIYFFFSHCNGTELIVYNNIIIIQYVPYFEVKRGRNEFHQIPSRGPTKTDVQADWYRELYSVHIISCFVHIRISPHQNCFANSTACQQHFIDTAHTNCWLEYESICIDRGACWYSIRMTREYSPYWLQGKTSHAKRFSVSSILVSKTIVIIYNTAILYLQICDTIQYRTTYE